MTAAMASMAMARAQPGGASDSSASKPQTRAEAKQAAFLVMEAYEQTRPIASGGCGAYVKLGDLVWSKVVQAKWFADVIYSSILVSCVYAGASTYDSINTSEWMANVDLVLAIIFLVESFLKIVAESTKPWRYFYGNPFWRWNCFDFLSKQCLRQFIACPLS